MQASGFPPQKQQPAQADTSADGHDWKKRFGDLQTHYDSTKTEKDQLQESLSNLQAKYDALLAGQVPTGETKEEPAAAKQAEESNEGKSDNPEMSAIQEELNSLREESNNTKRDKAAREIRKAHPDFDEIKNSDEFHTWAKSKSEQIQASIYQNPYDFTAAIEALDLYKFESAKAAQAAEAEQQKAQANDDASQLVPSHPAGDPNSEPKEKVWKTSEIDYVTKNPELLFKYIDDINLAQAEGRVVKDT